MAIISFIISLIALALSGYAVMQTRKAKKEQNKASLPGGVETDDIVTL